MTLDALCIFIEFVIHRLGIYCITCRGGETMCVLSAWSIVCMCEVLDVGAELGLVLRTLVLILMNGFKV